jgi:hypothetical protein
MTVLRSEHRQETGNGDEIWGVVAGRPSSHYDYKSHGALGCCALNAGRDIIAPIFCMIFKHLKDVTPDAEDSADEDETVERLAKDFASKVPEQEFSPAEIQSFLLENRHSSRRLAQQCHSVAERLQ